jgi:hypothetical protein
MAREDAFADTSALYAFVNKRDAYPLTAAAHRCVVRSRSRDISGLITSRRLETVAAL